jgi:hypothetical protein
LLFLIRGWGLPAWVERGAATEFGVGFFLREKEKKKEKTNHKAKKPSPLRGISFYFLLNV